MSSQNPAEKEESDVPVKTPEPDALSRLRWAVRISRVAMYLAGVVAVTVIAIGSRRGTAGLVRIPVLVALGVMLLSGFAAVLLNMALLLSTRSARRRRR